MLPPCAACVDFGGGWGGALIACPKDAAVLIHKSPGAGERRAWSASREGGGPSLHNELIVCKEVIKKLYHLKLQWRILPLAERSKGRKGPTALQAPSLRVLALGRLYQHRPLQPWGKPPPWGRYHRRDTTITLLLTC